MWLQYLIRALSAVPMIVAGIEAIHGESKTGAEKKAMAMDALGLSSAVASAIDPAHADAVQAATALASTTIDGVVTVMKQANEVPTQIPTVSIPANVTVIKK